MISNITKNYYYNHERLAFFRVIDNSKHLMYMPQYKGLAAFNADLYNQYRDKSVRIGWRDLVSKPNKAYWMTMEKFDKLKTELNFAEKQYLVTPLSAWESIIINKE